ncbi:hypothetical protein [Amycolatopsis sp. NPDC051102]|uniref:hypothetical protein n=1 Tax=Amycolatopsis sp. NPDC051102 TaxID=3155163 RepID=UPI00341BD2BE
MNNDNVSTRTPSPVLLWVGLVLSGTVNAAGPLVGLGWVPRMVAGVIALAMIALLVVHHVRRRR